MTKKREDQEGLEARYRALNTRAGTDRPRSGDITGGGTRTRLKTRKKFKTLKIGERFRLPKDTKTYIKILSNRALAEREQPQISYYIPADKEVEVLPSEDKEAQA